jgi:hypothetical protein
MNVMERRYRKYCYAVHCCFGADFAGPDDWIKGRKILTTTGANSIQRFQEEIFLKRLYVWSAHDRMTIFKERDS